MTTVTSGGAVSAAPLPQPPPTPLHDRLASLRDTMDTVSEFLEWLSNQGYEVCAPSEIGFVWIGKRPETLIAEWLEVDPQELEKEKQTLLAYQRACNAQQNATGHTDA